jgi:hypothetical protein
MGERGGTHTLGRARAKRHNLYHDLQPMQRDLLGIFPQRYIPPSIERRIFSPAATLGPRIIVTSRAYFHALVSPRWPQNYPSPAVNALGVAVDMPRDCDW